MTWLNHLPTLNAALNVTSVCLLLLGYRFIKQGRIEAHKKTMIAAVCTSALFLTSYLVYHFNVGSIRFQGQGAVRPVYFTILLTHTILAATVAPLVLVTLYRGLKGTYDRHRQIARRTFPIWVYVSITGVVIYVMLYHLYSPQS